MKNTVNNRNKQLTFIIKPSITYSDYVNAIIITLSCIFAFYVFFGIAFFFCSKSYYVPRAMEFVDESDIVNTPSTCNGKCKIKKKL